MENISKEFWADLRWGEEHHTEFLEKYRDKWVAIDNKKVIAFGESLEEVEKNATNVTGKTHVPVIFVECGEHIYVQS